MSKYRQVQVGYWQDGFVLDLTPEEKYFYIYLMTNSKASQIGIYELPKRIIETETGYNRETVEKLIRRFIDYKKIDYNDSTKEIMLLNWARHNWNNSPKVVSRVEEELRSVKHVPFALSYLDIVNSIKSDTVSIQYPYGMDSLYKQEIRDKDKEKEKDKDKDKDKEQQHSAQDAENLERKKPVAADSPGMVFRFYEANMGPIVQTIADHLNILIDESSEELVHEALRRAVVANATNKMRFAEKILSSWHGQRLKSLADIAAADKAFERKKQQYTGYGSKTMREEKLPEWFNSTEAEKSPEASQPVPYNLEAEKQKLLDKLAAKKAAGERRE